MQVLQQRAVLFGVKKCNKFIHVSVVCIVEKYFVTAS